MTNVRAKAIALCRVSTQGQANDGNLVPQEENVRKAADVLDAELVKIWSLAVSSRKGKNLNRKDLHEMLDYCKRYKSVKYLIVDEVDRFMRSIDEYFWWKMEFKIIGVRIVHANRPDIDPDDDRAVFDELIDVYRAEQSNNERIHKTPDKMKSKLCAGYYPSNPHTGYKRSDVPGLHIPDEPNWSIIQKAFKAMAAGEMDISEARTWANQQGLRTKNYGPRAVGGNTVDMYRWKVLMVDDYYWGKLTFADWELPEDLMGLHRPMITKEEHDVLVQIVKNKGKRFTIKRDNPEFVLSNLVECTRCVLSEYTHPRVVGFWQNNGKKKGYKRYRRYSCRACGLGLRQEALHQEVCDELAELKLSSEQHEKLKLNLRKIWSLHEKALIERAYIAGGRVNAMKERKSKLLDSLVDNPELKDDIKEKVEAIKLEIVEAEKVADEARDFENDFDEFIDFAFDFMDNKEGKWWELDKSTLVVYKQIVFPAGIQVVPDKKVYIPKVSPIYTYKNKKTPRKEADSDDFSHSGGPTGARTRDTRLKRPLLYQLSYGPSSKRTFQSRFGFRQKLRSRTTLLLSKLKRVSVLVSCIWCAEREINSLHYP